MVKVTPGGVSGILGGGTQGNAEVKVGSVRLHSYGRAQHAALCFVVFPKQRRERFLLMKRKEKKEVIIWPRSKDRKIKMPVTIISLVTGSAA